MARLVADQNFTCLINESGTYGSVSGTGQWLGNVQSFDPDENTGIMQVRYQGTSTRNVNQFVNGPLDFTGTLSYYPQDWRMLLYALGSCVDAGSPSPYTHVISELNSGSSAANISGADNPFTSFSIEHSQKAVGAGNNFVRTYNGCVVNSFTLNAANGEAVSCDVDWVAQNCVFSSGAPTAATEDTTRPYIWSDVRVHVPSGTVVDAVRNASLTISNNLDARHYDNGSRVIKVPVPGNREYSIELTMDGTSEYTKTFFDQRFLGGAGSTFNVMLEVNASTGSEAAYFVFSGCTLTEMSAPGGIDGVNEQSVTIVPQNCIINVDDLVFKYNPW